ncbi:MAG: hypothetical protein AAGB04_00065 [Pseudomonadota bacterium]
MCFKTGPGCGCCGDKYPKYKYNNPGTSTGGTPSTLSKATLYRITGSPGNPTMNDPEKTTWGSNASGPWWFEAEGTEESFIDLRSNDEYVWLLSHGTGDISQDIRIYRIPQIHDSNKNATGQILEYDKWDVSIPAWNQNPLASFVFSPDDPHPRTSTTTMLLTVVNNNYVVLREPANPGITTSGIHSFYYHRVSSSGTLTHNYAYISSSTARVSLPRWSIDGKFLGSGFTASPVYWQPYDGTLIYSHKDAFAESVGPLTVVTDENIPVLETFPNVYGYYNREYQATFTAFKIERGWRVVQPQWVSRDEFSFSTVKEKLYTSPSFLVNQTARTQREVDEGTPTYPFSRCTQLDGTPSDFQDQGFGFTTADYATVDLAHRDADGNPSTPDGMWPIQQLFLSWGADRSTVMLRREAAFNFQGTSRAPAPSLSEVQTGYDEDNVGNNAPPRISRAFSFGPAIVEDTDYPYGYHLIAEEGPSDISIEVAQNNTYLSSLSDDAFMVGSPRGSVVVGYVSPNPDGAMFDYGYLCIDAVSGFPRATNRTAVLPVSLDASQTPGSPRAISQPDILEYLAAWPIDGFDEDEMSYADYMVPPIQTTIESPQGGTHLTDVTIDYGRQKATEAIWDISTNPTYLVSIQDTDVKNSGLGTVRGHDRVWSHDALNIPQVVAP